MDFPRALYRTLLALTMMSASHGQAADAPHIVTSLKPIELLVRAVATEETRVTTLVPANASPHTYQMRPSERKALANADLILWVGPSMETFLERLLTGDEFLNRAVALAPGGAASESEEHHNGHQDNDHDHGEGEDPHIWLDPAQAIAMVERIHAELSRLPNADQAALDRNLDEFRTGLADTEQRIQKQLSDIKSVSIFTYHDAFSQFAEHYDLAIAGVMTLSPERTPGARHLAEVQDKLASATNPCLLTEPQFNRKWWRSITDGIEITMSTWDPLAADMPADAEGYLKFQQHLADAVTECMP